MEDDEQQLREAGLEIVEPELFIPKEGKGASVDLDMNFSKDMESWMPRNSNIIDSSYECDSKPMGVYNSHQKSRLLLDAYISIKDNVSDEVLLPLENEIFELKSPMGNTVVHVAAMHGNDLWVEKTAQYAPNILTETNDNGDTPLHLAAKAGHKKTVDKLLVAILRSSNFTDMEEATKTIMMENNQGNTLFHEALYNGHKDLVNLEDYACFQGNTGLRDSVQLSALKLTNKENKSILYLAIEAGYKELVDKALSKVNSAIDFVPPGKSFFLAAILKQDQGTLKTILERKPEWIHLTDKDGRMPLHYAACTGYLDGVQYLLEKCSSCANVKDKDGFFPLHLASYEGHVDVVEKLLQDRHYPYPGEILDENGRNILHLATESGKYNVVRYIFKSTNHELQEMINEKDLNGNTPLHLATRNCHPKIVHALTWDNRVKLNLTNDKNQTALDVCQEFSLENLSLRQRLTWTALKSAGVKYAAQLGPHYIKVPPKTTENRWEQEASNMDKYKDRINTLMLVSTLIVTVTFAAGFTLPGSTDSSDQGKGKAFMLYHTLFKVYILCITVSMYGALSVTITLIWAQLGDLTLAILALKLVKPILGVTLATLSVAFMAGLHLVISDLKWLATTTLALCVIFILTLLFLYTFLWFPSVSRNIAARYISYYPFLVLASLVDREETSAKC